MKTMNTKDAAQWGKYPNAIVEERIRGKKTRFRELMRAFKIMREYYKGTEAFRDIGNCITVFGSARFAEDHKYYQKARELGSQIVEHGYAVMTGGGPGIMEAANRGAKEANGTSIGCNIQLEHEQEPNEYLDRWITMRYFFIRKVLLTKYSSAFMVLPGGLGTLDEFFEMVTLLQTAKIRSMPVCLICKEYWEPLIHYLENTLLPAGTIDEEDTKRMLVTDSSEDAIEYVKYAHHDMIKSKKE